MMRFKYQGQDILLIYYLEECYYNKLYIINGDSSDRSIVKGIGKRNDVKGRCQGKVYFKILQVGIINTLLQYMRQLFKSQDRGEKSPRRGRSQSKTHQFRQVITKITHHYPKGHYFAYCIVSKESAQGFFLNQRLLVLDTFKQQLKYYSHIPDLPLGTHEDLIVAKEIINFNKIKQLQFIPEKIRIGHVMVKWKVNKQLHSWKLIMGGNKIAKEFSDLISQALKMHRERQDKRFQRDIQDTTRGNINDDKNSRVIDDLKERQFQKQKNRSKISAPSEINQHILTLPSENDRQKRSKKNSFSQLQKKTNSELSLSQQGSITNIQINKQVRQRKQDSIVNLRMQEDILQISKKRRIERSKTQLQDSLIQQWLKATIQVDKATVYNKFMHKCFKKIEKIMQSFISFHLDHQQVGNRCVIKDGELQIIYIPIIESTTEQMHPQALIVKIREEEELLREWQSLNFIAGYNYTSKYKILTPMCSVFHYKSFKFLCKSSIQTYDEKTRVYYDEIKAQIGQLQEMCHINICNGKEEMYLIDNGLGKIIYFDRVSSLPHFYEGLPINYNYIQNYVLEGKISNARDIEAISKYISQKLITQITDKLNQSILISTVEMMQILQEYGITQHYLPFFIDRSVVSQQIDYFGKLVYTEMLACAFQWQLRKRMQLQVFKNKEFGFAVHQIQSCLILLFKEDKYFLTVLNNHLLQYFKCRIPQNCLPLQNYIIITHFIISVFTRLSFNCKLTIQEADYKIWYWKQKNIYNNMQLTPFISCEFLRVQCFSLSPKLFRQSLVNNINFQINRTTSIEHVLKCLNCKGDKNGYEIPQIYDCMNVEVKKKTNFYLSHFISPLINNRPSLQQEIYYDDTFIRYNSSSIQYLTMLNKIRWLIKSKKADQADVLMAKSIEKAIIWGHNSILVHLYNFASKYKLNSGEIDKALTYSIKALNHAQQLYQNEKSMLIDLLIAEQAFESANLHFSVHDFTKALQLYATAESILNKIKGEVEEVKLNGQFMKVYINKSLIHLMFNERKECLDTCLLGIKNSVKFNSEERSKVVNYQFKLYTILFRFYQMNKMRRQMLEVAKICSWKYLEDKVSSVDGADQEIVIEVVKMLWSSIIKQIEINQSHQEKQGDFFTSLRKVQLKKVREEILLLKDVFNGEYRYSTKQMVIYLSSKIKKKKISEGQCLLLKQMVHCMGFVSVNKREERENGEYMMQGVQNEWLFLQSLSVLCGYSYLIGQIQDYLHIYTYQL